MAIPSVQMGKIAEIKIQSNWLLPFPCPSIYLGTTVLICMNSQNLLSQKTKPISSKKENLIGASKFLIKTHNSFYKRMGWEHKIDCVCREWDTKK